MARPLQGILWTKAPDGCIFVNLDAVSSWIENEMPPPHILRAQMTSKKFARNAKP